MRVSSLRPFVLAALLAAAPASAQLQASEGHRFREAVRKAEGPEVLKFLEQPGVTVVNSQDSGSGEAAIHIVARRGDELYLRYLLQKGANPNLRDGRGNTPLLLAVTGGYPGLIDLLVKGKANVNLANSAGETPLILAVQRRDLGMIRVLLAAGADPDQSDIIAGKSARDYAAEDTRTPVIAKLLADAPKRQRRAVSGPGL